jgi:hypothetical protein
MQIKVFPDDYYVGKNDAASIIRRWIELPMVEHLYGAKTL